MASTIAAITTGIGGIVTTADATGNLSLLSGTSTVVAVTSAGAAVTGTMSVSGATTLTGGLNTPLAVTSGGTGLGTLTANNVILGAGTSNPTFVAPSTTGNLLTSNGTTWTSAAAPASGVTTFNGSTTGLTPATATSGAITLGGTLAVANGGTGVATSTGSGANVLGTSPTLTTPTISTITSAAATALTLQSASTTAVTIDTSQNVGIGTTSPSTFGKFAVVGGNAYADGGYFAKNSTSTADTILKMPLYISTLILRPNGDSTVEFFNDVYGSALAIKQANVGIGTTSPLSSSKLTVSGAVASNGGLSADLVSAISLDFSGGEGRIIAQGSAGNSAAITFRNGNSGSGTTERMRIDTSGNLLFNSGYGSVATAYGCRAWVNFNGTGTVAIRASGNVSSITDNAVGQYTVNFTTAMVDVNYSAIGTVSDLNAPGSYESFAMLRGGFTTGSCPVDSVDYTSNNKDVPYNCWAFFR